MWFVLGLALLASDNPGGFVFFILGLAWMARTTEPGESWAREHPNITRGIIVGLVALSVLAVIGTLVLNNIWKTDNRLLGGAPGQRMDWPGAMRRFGWRTREQALDYNVAIRRAVHFRVALFFFLHRRPLAMLTKLGGYRDILGEVQLDILCYTGHRGERRRV